MLGKEGKTILQSFLTVFEQMFRILILIGVGFAFNKLNLIPKEAGRVMSRLVTLLFLPAIVLHTNLVECRIDSLAQYSNLVLYGGVFCLVSVGLSYLFSGKFARGDNYIKGVYRYAISFPNTGAVGTPLVLAMFGTAGLFRYNLFLFVSTIVTYSWGIMQLQPSHKREGGVLNTLHKVINPTFVGMILGLVLGVLGAKTWLPSVVIDTVDSLGGCYTTISLMLTGFTIANYPFAQTLGSRRVYIYTAARLLVIPCVFLFALRLINAPVEACIMTALTYACPCGMNTVVFPASYGEDCHSGASMVLISSICSILTAPLVYALAVG